MGRSLKSPPSAPLLCLQLQLFNLPTQTFLAHGLNHYDMNLGAYTRLSSLFGMKLHAIHTKSHAHHGRDVPSSSLVPPT